jgi:enoyl-CoA hydratase/carnithine racemase
MRFAARGSFKFMQMEVGMGILPCGGGASRMARQVGLGRALEIVLSARDFDADEAEAYGTINKALDPDEIGVYVDTLARRIAQFPPSRSTPASRRSMSPSTSRSVKRSGQRPTGCIRRPARRQQSSVSASPTTRAWSTI